MVGIWSAARIAALTFWLYSSAAILRRFPWFPFLDGHLAPSETVEAAKDRRAAKKAQAGEIVLLSQDEARFPMGPTLPATLGVKGPKDAKKTTGKSQNRRLPEAFAEHWRHVGKVSVHEKHKVLLLLLDNAAWHRVGPSTEALAEKPHGKFKRRPSYRRPLKPSERFCKKRRHRATHKRLCDTRAARQRSLRASLSYFQTVRDKVASLLQPRPRMTCK